MKVKVGELKTHLSRYLKELQRSDEPIEVCVRESTVAYLTAADVGAEGGDALKRSLEQDGLEISQWGGPLKPLPQVSDSEDVDDSAVLAIRAEKEW